MAFVFRHYDQAELEVQVNARATVPDIAPFMEAYRRESARMRATLPCSTGIPYGPLECERLDIFPSARPGPSPVFIFIHGGYWRLLDASDSSFMAETFTKAGACVVALNYGLAPATTMPEITRQCRAAIRWVVQNIGRYGGDPGHLHVSGSSAGGHLAAMMLAGGWQEEFGIPAGSIRSASLLSGLFDLEPVQLSHVNEWARMDRETAFALSPLRHLPPHPTSLIVSYAPSETGEFKRQSEIYAAACSASGHGVEMVVEPGTNHFDLPLKFMDPAAMLTRATLRLMDLQG